MGTPGRARWRRLGFLLAYGAGVGVATGLLAAGFVAMLRWLDPVSAVAGASVMLPAQVFAVWGWWHRGRRLRRVELQLRGSTAAIRVLRERNEELAKELAARPAWARPAVSPAPAVRPPDPAPPVLLRKVDPAATVEIVPVAKLAQGAGVARYPRHSEGARTSRRGS